MWMPIHASASVVISVFRVNAAATVISESDSICVHVCKMRYTHRHWLIDLTYTLYAAAAVAAAANPFFHLNARVIFSLSDVFESKFATKQKKKQKNVCVCVLLRSKLIMRSSHWRRSTQLWNMLAHSHTHDIRIYTINCLKIKNEQKHTHKSTAESTLA